MISIDRAGSGAAQPRASRGQLPRGRRGQAALSIDRAGSGAAQPRASRGQLPRGRRGQAALSIDRLASRLVVLGLLLVPGLALAQGSPATPDSPAAPQVPPGHPQLAPPGAEGHGAPGAQGPRALADRQQGALATTRVVGAAKPDASLPKGTVVVTVLLDGKPVPQTRVTLARVTRSGDVKPDTVSADEKGVARWTNLEVGNTYGYMAAVKRSGLTFTSRPFSLGEQSGVTIELKTFARGATAGQVYLARGSHLVIEPGDEEVQVGLVVLIVNSGTQVFAPPGGFMLPLPEGAKAALIDEKNHDLQIVPGQGVRLRDGVKPGARELRLSYRMPYANNGKLDVAITFPIRVESLGLIIEHHEGLEVNGPTVEDRKRRQMSGRDFQVVLGGGVQASEPIRFQIAGLPVRDRRPRTVALSVAALILVWGIVYTRLRRPQRAPGSEPPRSAASDVPSGAASAGPAATTEPRSDLAELERRRQGVLDVLAPLIESDPRREELLEELADVLAELEEHPGRAKG